MPRSRPVETGAVRLAYVTTVPITQLAFLRGQNAYLQAHGFEIVAISSPGPALAELGRRDAIATVAVPISRRLEPLADVRSLFGLVRALRRVRPDMLHVSTPKAALLGAIAGWLTRVPVRVFFVRGLLSEAASGPSRRCHQWLERLTSRLCTHTLCVSPSLLRYARTAGLFPSAEVPGAGMSNGIDTERFTPAARPTAAGTDGVCIGFLGRLVRDKGIEELAAAWRSLRTRYPELRLLLVGEWESRNAVTAGLRRELEADPRVRTVGHVHDTVPYYAAMDLFAYPSYREGFPNAPMEAAAMGLPVVATRVSGCSDAVVDGETGTLVPARDAPALAAALERYIRDPALRAAHGAAGRARVVREFRQEIVWQAACETYCRILRERGFGPRLRSRAGTARVAAVAAADRQG